MSVSYYAHLVIGFAIEQDQLLIQPAVRGCSHRQSHSKFCGECGAPIWIQEEKIQEILFQNRMFSEFKPNTGNFESTKALPVLVGVKVEESVSLKTNTLETFGPLEEALRQELGRMNIVPKGPFGVHLYRYVSY